MCNLFFKKSLILCGMIMCLFGYSLSGFAVESVISATVSTSSKTAELSNGIISMTINSKGHVNYFALNGQDMVNAEKGGRFYFSYNSAAYHELDPTSVRIAQQTDNLVEVIYSSTEGEMVVEQSYILLKDVQGAYSYITLKGKTDNISLREMRVVYRTDKDLLTYAYVSDLTQGPMVTPAALTGVEEIMDATYKLADGSIYTKYNWANYVDEDIVHGLCNDNYGLWIISSSDEYLNGGPMKQELMVHGTSKTPLMLMMLQGEHFGAKAQTYSPGDEKIYGPFFIYANKADSREAVIADAKAYAKAEQSKWPYTWMKNPLYPINRTEVKGSLVITNGIKPKNMKVVLAQPGIALYDQGKEYMFWSKTDSLGNFSIPNVRAGNYSLYVYATEGEMTDEIEFENVEVKDDVVDLGSLLCDPTKYEDLLWQIGKPDRKASEFSIGEMRRAYGLWDLVPSTLDYTIGTSVEATDWYYAQTKDGAWYIKFNSDKTYSGSAYLTLGIAGAANSPRVVPALNGSTLGSVTFSNDASVYRSANTGGRYQKKVFKFQASKIRKGANSLALKVTDTGNRGGVIYDVIKLEAGNLITDINDVQIKESSVFVAPNPFSDDANIEITLRKSDDARVLLFDSNGRLVQEVFNGNLDMGNNTISLNCSNIASGIYILKVMTSDTIYSEKVIKL